LRLPDLRNQLLSQLFSNSDYNTRPDSLQLFCSAIGNTTSFATPIRHRHILPRLYFERTRLLAVPSASLICCHPHGLQPTGDMLFESRKVSQKRKLA
jgi:hypothetical protein